MQIGLVVPLTEDPPQNSVFIRGNNLEEHETKCSRPSSTETEYGSGHL